LRWGKKFPRDLTAVQRAARLRVCCHDSQQVKRAVKVQGNYPDQKIIIP
jgi:hypothetical protein